MKTGIVLIENHEPFPPGGFIRVIFSPFPTARMFKEWEIPDIEDTFLAHCFFAFNLYFKPFMVNGCKEYLGQDLEKLYPKQGGN